MIKAVRFVGRDLKKEGSLKPDPEVVFFVCLFTFVGFSMFSIFLKVYVTLNNREVFVEDTVL